MAISPWNFYRGAAAVMAADLASRPHSRIEVQLCGDAHVLNFGLWATPERNLNFDLRDFDETLPGPFEWDVARLAASLVVAARENGVKANKADAAVTAAVDAYRNRMRYYATLPILDIWYEGTRFDQFIDYFEPADRGQVKVQFEKGKNTRTSRGAFEKLTTERRGRARITPQPPLRVTLDDDEQGDIVEGLLGGYRLTLQEDRRRLFDRFTPVDVVRQVVGVGSVGMVVYLVLLEGSATGDPLFLQCKQAGPSVYETYTYSSGHDNHGARVIAGKRMVQSATDIFVGWGSLGGRDFYVRQFRDMKLIPTTDLIAPVLVEFAIACGNTLARAHARSGDPETIDAYMGKNDDVHQGHVQVRPPLRRPERAGPRGADRRHPAGQGGEHPGLSALLGQEQQSGVVGEVDERLGPHAEEHGHPRAQRDGQTRERRDRHPLGRLLRGLGLSLGPRHRLGLGTRPRTRHRHGLGLIAELGLGPAPRRPAGSAR